MCGHSSKAWSGEQSPSSLLKPRTDRPAMSFAPAASAGLTSCRPDGGSVRARVLRGRRSAGASCCDASACLATAETPPATAGSPEGADGRLLVLAPPRRGLRRLRLAAVVAGGDGGRHARARLGDQLPVGGLGPQAQAAEEVRGRGATQSPGCRTRRRGGQRLLPRLSPLLSLSSDQPPRHPAPLTSRACPAAPAPRTWGAR